MDEFKYILKTLTSYVIVIILCYLLFSCRSKKTTTERTQISDTLIKTTLEYKSLPIENTYTIDLICDTITGKVKPVNIKEKSGNNYASLLIENNQLKAKLKTGQSEKKIDTIYQTKYKDVYKDREVVKNKTPFWHWLLHALFLLFIVYRFKKLF